MDDARLPRRNSSSIDKDFTVLWQGETLGEFWNLTDMQVAINESNRRKDASFKIRVGKAGTTQTYQQAIPMDFARSYKNLLQERVTLEGPTGQTWTMVIRDFHKTVRFGRGWRQFSVENHLQAGYQLLFTLVGRFYFRVQFFDRLGNRCTSYPPLPVTQSGSQPGAETQRQPGFQQEVDAGQASHRHGSEAQTSATVPLMGTSPNSAIPQNSDHDYVIPRQYGPEVRGPVASLPDEHMRELEEDTSDAWNDSEDMEADDEEKQELDEGQHYIFQGSDIDEAPIYHPPATMQQPLPNPKRNIHTMNELSRGKQQAIFHSPDNRAHSPQIQDHNKPPSLSRGDVLPCQYYPEIMRKKPVTVLSKRPPPVAPPVASPHEAGGSSGSSPAMRVLQQHGYTRFSEIKLKCERRDVSHQERRVVVDAAKRFVSALENEKNFMVVMRDEHVYRRFRLTIPAKILEATGTERASKVEVCLLDREQAQYKTHWTRENYFDMPTLNRDAWAKFAVDHALEEGDVCVFQLLQTKRAVESMPAFLFCVHIFRVVEIPVGQLDFSDAMENN